MTRVIWITFLAGLLGGLAAARAEDVDPPMDPRRRRSRRRHRRPRAARRSGGSAGWPMVRTAPGMMDITVRIMLFLVEATLVAA